MVFEIIQQNFVGVAITSFLILFILTNNNFEKRINRLFLISALCVMLLIVTETWEAQLTKLPYFSWLRIPLSAIGYSVRPLIPYLLTLMFHKQFMKKMFLLSMPLIINCIIAFSALFCDISFSYTADNQFIRGPLGYAPFITAAIYIVLLLTLTIKENRKGSLIETMIVSAIVLLAFLSTVMESVFGFRAIQNVSIATSITYYYLFLHSNSNNRDPLTGSLTRRKFYLDADKYRSSLTAVISIDLNNLKTLNDKYGHIEGDKALTTITQIIKGYMNNRASLYRIGGDEFIILCYKFSEEKVQNLINKIRADLEKTEYSCAIGYAMYENNEDLDKVCQCADNAMYENKRKMKNQVSD